MNTITLSQPEPASLVFDATANVFLLKGHWTLSGLADFKDQWAAKKEAFPQGELTLDGEGVLALDTAGAEWLSSFMERFKSGVNSLTMVNFKSAHAKLLHSLQQYQTPLDQMPKKPASPNILHIIGKQTLIKYDHIMDFLAFWGELVCNLGRLLLKPHKIPWVSFLVTIETAGYGALPIIALLSFLIGVVLTYEMGLQLKVYGANIFIVNLSGMAVLREFGPLLTAIIVASRTSSAFTASLGTMKVNEEMDALTIMGLSPMERLVVPKILALLLIMPLLIVWADVFGILGSMVMSKGMLSLNYYDFLHRFHTEIPLSTYLRGLVKAPVFALIIAAVGCFQGTQVKGSAMSIGTQTTKSVVQSIFLIIIADASFSILFSWQGG